MSDWSEEDKTEIARLLSKLNTSLDTLFEHA